MTIASTRAQAHTQRAGQSLLAQARATGSWLRELSPEAFQQPSVLGGKRVHDIVARLHLAALDLNMTLQRPTAQRAVSLEQYLRSLRDQSIHDARAAADLGGRLPSREVVREYCAVIARTEEDLGGSLPAVVETRFDAVRTVDLLRAKLMELLVATDDMNASLPQIAPAPLERQARFDVARSYADVVGALHPGRSVELRVPPATAVQLATAEGGPTHTRGTPPTVVETDPVTFIRLCAGRLRWADALATHRVQASGAHADLSGVFPVLWAAA